LVGRLPYAPSALALTIVLAWTPSARTAPNDLASPDPSATALRWTDETPDAMVDDATARALGPTATVRDELAALSTIAALASRATEGYASKALARIAADSSGKPDDVRGEAALLGRMLANDDGTESGAEQDERIGIIDALSILGPFRDTGGGLDAHDGPEAPDAAFGDMRARYSWGSYEVAWRSVPRAFAPARGVALDLFVFPRKESCSWVATKLTVASKQSLFLRLAATGQARLVFDGANVGRDDAVHEGLRFDRIAARVHAEAGTHLLAAKVCSGALDDDGRVRLRVTDQNGSAPRDVTASADLSGQGARPGGGRAAAVDRVPTPP
jgi:hypothetical protein